MKKNMLSLEKSVLREFGDTRGRNHHYELDEEEMLHINQGHIDSLMSFNPESGDVYMIIGLQKYQDSIKDLVYATAQLGTKTELMAKKGYAFKPEKDGYEDRIEYFCRRKAKTQKNLDKYVSDLNSAYDI